MANRDFNRKSAYRENTPRDLNNCWQREDTSLCKHHSLIVFFYKPCNPLNWYYKYDVSFTSSWYTVIYMHYTVSSTMYKLFNEIFYHCLFTLHTAKILKIWNKYSQDPNSTFMCLWRYICIPTIGLPVLLQEKYVDRSWEYINRSQTHEYGNWDWGRPQFLFWE